MKTLRFVLAAAILALPAGASAQTVVPLSQFKSIELNGGGRVTLRHGPVQRVTITRGSLEISRIEVEGPSTRRIGRNTYNNNGQKLVIDACRSSCRNYDLQVEIVTPDVDAVAVRGGGEIRTMGNFPTQSSIAAAVSGGGQIDIRSFPATSVAAAVQGGGSILTRPRTSLAASVSGGGSVAYWGNPSVVQTVRGGGAVSRGGER